jgi:hypothetical protein
LRIRDVYPGCRIRNTEKQGCGSAFDTVLDPTFYTETQSGKSFSYSVEWNGVQRKLWTYLHHMPHVKGVANGREASCDEFFIQVPEMKEEKK